MAEVSKDSMADLDHENSSMRGNLATPNRPVQRDVLLLVIAGAALGLTFLIILVAAFWGSGPVLAQAPWYIPLISSFVALTTLSISYLAFGRFHVMRDPLSFWAGSGFAAYGIGQVFYALSWPGLLPNGDPILGHLTNTSAAIALVDLTILDAALLAAILAPWPRRESLTGTRWQWVVAGGLVIVASLFGALIFFESYLPGFVDSTGTYTLNLRIWVAIQLVMYAVGAIFSTMRLE